MNQFFLHNLWRWKSGLPELSEFQTDNISIKSLKETEWSNNFERLMRNRLIMGALRYGKLHAENKPQYNRIESIIKRARKYTDTGNKEFLVDMANFCLLEFEECKHINAHFSSIDDGDHVEIK